MSDDEQGRQPRDPSGAPPDGTQSAADLARQIHEKASKDAEESEGSMTATNKRRSRIALLAAVAVAAIAVAVVPYFIGPPGTPIESPPDELLGTWSTSEPRYADRRMTFTPDQFIMDLGRDGRRVYSIGSIFVEVGDVHRMYTINYSDEDGEQSMDVFVYDDGLLRLRNPSEVRWTRAPM